MKSCPETIYQPHAPPQARVFAWVLIGSVLKWCPKGPPVLPSEGHMGNIGLTQLKESDFTADTLKRVAEFKRQYPVYARCRRAIIVPDDGFFKLARFSELYDIENNEMTTVFNHLNTAAMWLNLSSEAMGLAMNGKALGEDFGGD